MFNMAPINASDVGLKTDLVTINPSQLSAEWDDINTQRWKEYKYSTTQVKYHYITEILLKYK